ncbi:MULTISPECIES: phage tail protein [Convivina]|uniref:Phage minor structural protein n=1 Tax=Convivina intestini TaxID=1505726 RepID=A0A2U1DFQ8_9LACO|nr:MULTISPECIES: phage tail protein [Convivina]PVY86505.1 phage minor structural protein [Convivina intestini]CAH1853338.1 hypothetical protein R077815_00803 [Convivina sp. LMG 32447]CAH1857595.1 hypothetical protein R077811_01621 [Convivina intestini]SDC12799.1 phage minor structural protein, N-terminal region [Leuconostocaceae bacterium R-53105]
MELANNFVTFKNASGDETAANTFALQVTENINELSTCTFQILSEAQNKVAIEMLQPLTKFYIPTVGQWFQITNVSSNSQVNTRLFNISGVQVGTALHAKFIEDKLNGSQSLDACMQFITKDTAFSYVINDHFNNYGFSDGFGGDYADQLLMSTLKDDFGFELLFDNYTIHIYKQIGQNDQFVFVDGYNASKINSTEDYTNVATYIKGNGKPNEGENATGYQATADYLSPNASIWGKIQAQTISDERFTDSNALRDYIKSKLQDYPIVQYTMERAEFEHHAKFAEVNNVKIGNYGLLKDRLGIDVDVRIIGMSYYPNDPNQTDTVTFGNKLFDFAHNMQMQGSARRMNESIKKDLSGINESVQDLLGNKIGLEFAGKVTTHG